MFSSWLSVIVISDSAACTGLSLNFTRDPGGVDEKILSPCDGVFFASALIGRTDLSAELKRPVGT